MSAPRVFVRGLLLALFATAALVALIGLGGAGHGPFRRFMVLLAAVVFMNRGVHWVAWNFMYVPIDWTWAMIIDSAVTGTLAGVPAVMFLRSMREGDTPKEFKTTCANRAWVQLFYATDSTLQSRYRTRHACGHNWQCAGVV